MKMSLKTLLAGVALAAAVYGVVAYDVEIAVKEAAAVANCNPSDPNCGG